MYFSLCNITDIQQLTKVILPLTHILGICNQITILIAHQVTSVQVLGSHHLLMKIYVFWDVTPYLPTYYTSIFS
jgi:hypothetical protein